MWVRPEDLPDDVYSLCERLDRLLDDPTRGSRDVRGELRAKLDEACKRSGHTGDDAFRVYMGLEEDRLRADKQRRYA